MRPKQHATTGSVDLFRARLDQIINLKHELVQLAGKIDWQWIDGEIAPLYIDQGRPGIATRFVIGLLLLKHIYGLSDEGVCELWVHDPYFQYFTGEEFFQHEFPHERSDLSHWRKRLGDKLELLLAESLRVAHASGALRTKDLARVTVDTTVQPKNITFPTDAKLLHAAIKGLNRMARKHGVRLRQSYLRIAKHAAMMAGRYAHAKQFNRHRRQLRLLRTRLGRIIRDIRRKIIGQAELEEAFIWPLARASQIRFSNRPLGVKRFQTIHHCSVNVAHGVVLLFGIGTKALPAWGSKKRWNNLTGGLAVRSTVGPSGSTISPHPSSREGHHSTARWSSGFLQS